MSDIASQDIEITDNIGLEVALNEQSVNNEDNVPLKQKIGYGMGVVSDHYANICLSIFLMAFFCDFLKVSPTWVAATMMVARIWDAFTDPMVGSLSDGCKSRFGRRKPFIFAGAILTGILFPLIWMVPESWSDTATLIYLVVALLAYYTTYSIFSVPYESLGTEMTADYKERTNIFVIRSYVQQVFNLGIIWVFPLATWLVTTAWIDNEVGGVRAVSWLIAIVIIAAGIIPALSCAERYKDIAAKQTKDKFLPGLRSLLANKPLLIVIGVIATYLLAIMATMQLAYFVNTYYVCEGEIHAGTTLGAIDGSLRFFFAILGGWFIKKLSDKYDKHHLMMGCVLMLIVAFIGIYFTTIPGRPWLTLVMKPLLAFGEVGFWILIISMKADVCDHDELHTGKRREGLISAASNWFIKLTIAMAMFLGGVMLEHFVKFDSQLDDAAKASIEAQAESVMVESGSGSAVVTAGEQGAKPMTKDDVIKELTQKAVMAKQSPGTMERLLLTYTIPPVIALMLAFFMLMKYPLTHKRLNEIRDELERRRGKAVAE